MSTRPDATPSGTSAIAGLVLVTGAAGEIGRALRRAVADRYRLRATDVAEMSAATPSEELVRADLAAPAEIERAMQGVEVVVHLGGIACEHTWERIAAVNIGGTQAVLEAARKAGARRVILASSVHAVGMYPRSSMLLGVDAPVRPDSFYGVSKVAGEALGRLYAEKWGLEVACLRIASYQERPRDRRHLSTWLSPGDMVRLVTCAIESPYLARARFAVMNGISANTRRWMADDHWHDLGYAPVDDAEVYAREVEHVHGPDEDIGEQVQGGFFAAPGFRGLG